MPLKKRKLTVHNPADKLPEPHPFIQPNAKYYTVYTEMYGAFQAMYLGDEQEAHWYTSYATLLVAPVVEWVEEIIE